MTTTKALIERHPVKILLFGLIGGALAGIAAVAARYRREIGVARGRVASLGSRVIETACGPIEYARVADGYPVLVVHGAMGGFDQGLMLADRVIDSDYQVISVSRFGYLRSPLPADATITAQADAFACLLDALDIRRSAVYGVSGGANSSIRFAARHPERVSALVLGSPAAPGKVRVASPPRAIFDTLMRSDFAYWALIAYFTPIMQSLIGVPRGFVVTPELESEVRATLAATLPSSERIDGMIFDAYTSAPEFYESISEASPYPLGSIETPVLVINALDDPLAVPENVRGLADRIPNARLFVVPDGGHGLLGHSEEARSEITRFLRANVTAPKYSRQWAPRKDGSSSLKNE